MNHRKFEEKNSRENVYWESFTVDTSRKANTYTLKYIALFTHVLGLDLNSKGGNSIFNVPKPVMIKYALTKSSL